MEPARKRVRRISSEDAPFEAGNAETVQQEDPQDKALANDYILAEVFSYLPVEDLKECRLVNRIWNQESTRKISPRLSVVRFDPRLWKTLRPSWDFPCKKFEINGDMVEKDKPGERLELPKFFEKVAPTALHLKIAVEPYDRIASPSPTLEYAKLNSLELYVKYWENCKTEVAISEVLESNVDLMIAILKNSPNLEALCLRFYAEEDAVRKQYLRLLDHVPWKQIRKLELHGEIENAHFQRVLEMAPQMQLEAFHLSTLSLLEPSLGKSFQAFLDWQSGSLKTLELEFMYPKPEPDSHFPRFPNLKTLKIKWHQEDEDIEENLTYPLALSSFPRLFPEVTSFSLSIYIPEFYAYYRDIQHFICSQDMRPAEKVQELELDFGNSFNYLIGLGEENARNVVRHLGQMFPRVKKLKLAAHRPLLEAVNKEKAWSSLEELTLDFRYFNHIDPLTGCSITESRRIRQMEAGSEERWTAEREIEDRIPAFFHQLKVLVLRHATAERYALKDFACRVVLLKLDSLECLNLSGLQMHQISEGMIRQMSGKFKILDKPR